MNLEIINNPDEDLVVKLHGEMDAQGCSELRPELEQIANSETDRNVVLNMGQVSFLDSSGVGVIVFLYKRLKAQSRGLEIDGAHGQPQELMELLRIDKVIPVGVSPLANHAMNGNHD